MIIKVIKCTDNEGWYSNRIGDTFTVLKESKDIEGQPMYVIDIERNGNSTITSYVLADDCVVID